MDNSDLIKKYGLAPDGLQSLFDKLVNGGYIDLAEVQERMPGFLGTVEIYETTMYRGRMEAKAPPKPVKAKSGALINAQEAVRDIRSGLDDGALMEKYRLSHKGLKSLFDKMMDVGLIPQADLDRKSLGLEVHTVALSEELLTLSSLYEALGANAQHETTAHAAKHLKGASHSKGQAIAKTEASEVKEEPIKAKVIDRPGPVVDGSPGL
ncbi:MAG: hypothetical protein WBG50_17735 [Desulfomonilaceae bacterium]